MNTQPVPARNVVLATRILLLVRYNEGTMKSIEISVDNQRAVFTPRAVEIDGVTFEYSSLIVIRHRPADHMYMISDGLRHGSATYEEKDAEALHTLFSRIAQLRNIRIEEFEPTSAAAPFEPVSDPVEPEAAASTADNTASTEKDAATKVPPDPSVSSKQTGLLQRPVFLVIEIAVAALLLAIGIYLFFIAF